MINLGVLRVSLLGVCLLSSILGVSFKSEEGRKGVDAVRVWKGSREWGKKGRRERVVEVWNREREDERERASHSPSPPPPQ